MSLTLQDIGYTIGEAKLLKNITLKANPGELTAIVGPNGAGKSTALKLLSGDIQPTYGNVTINDEELGTYSAKNLAHLRAVLPQQIYPAFGLKVWEMVRLARAPFNDNNSETAYYIEEALNLVDAVHLADRDVMTLSGGEKQRVFLAKALAQVSMRSTSSDNRRYLLLDEPTASLDLKQAQIVMRILRKAADEGLGIIVILHDLASTRRYADKAFVLKEGTVDVCGSPIECLTKENISQVFDIDLTTAEDSLHEVI